MLPLVHFTVSILIALALEIRFKNKLMLILMLGVLGTLPDLDHFLPYNNGVGVFHNPIFLFALPVAFLLGAFLLENTVNKSSSKIQRLFLCVTVILLSHFLLDIASGKIVSINLSTSAQTFMLASTPMLTTQWGTLIETKDMVWIFLVMTVVFGNLAQRIMYMNAEAIESTEIIARKKRLNDLHITLSKPKLLAR